MESESLRLEETKNQTKQKKNKTKQKQQKTHHTNKNPPHKQKKPRRVHWIHVFIVWHQEGPFTPTCSKSSGTCSEPKYPFFTALPPPFLQVPEANDCKADVNQHGRTDRDGFCTRCPQNCAASLAQRPSPADSSSSMGALSLEPMQTLLRGLLMAQGTVKSNLHLQGFLNILPISA